MGMKVFAKLLGLSRCNGKEGEVYDGMVPSSHLTFHEVGVNRPCFRLKMVSKDGWSSSMWKLVVDVVDGPIQVTRGG